MPPRTTPRTVSGRLRAAPGFALNFTLDGCAHVAKDAEPNFQYWLTEPYRILRSLFSSRRGATPVHTMAGESSEVKTMSHTEKS